MRNTRFLAALGLAALSAIVLAKFVTVDELMKKKSEFDQKVVTVRGKVDKFTEKTSKAGNEYTTFTMMGEKQKLNGYLREHLKKAPKNGDVIEITGTFRLEKKVGDRVFKDEVDATSEKGKPYGVKIIASGNGK